MEKRGVSDVVTSVMLVLLTVVAVSILAAVIIPYVRNSLNASTACLDYGDYFKFEGSSPFNCYEKTGNEYAYKISVGANGENKTAEKIAGFNLVFYTSAGSTKVEIKSGISPGIKMLSGEEAISIPNPGEWKTYVYSGSAGVTKAEVYPLVGERICGISDTINIIECS
jgi:hypothetical protein